MNPWVFILLVGAAAVFGLDLLIRRKKWQNNTRGEKISLIIHMFSIGPHAFLSGLGMLWGLAAGSPETAFGQILYDVTLVLAGFYFIPAIAAAILPFVFRKMGKIKASIWTTVIALLYIIVVLTVNTLAGSFL